MVDVGQKAKGEKGIIKASFQEDSTPILVTFDNGDFPVALEHIRKVAPKKAEAPKAREEHIETEIAEKDQQIITKLREEIEKTLEEHDKIKKALEENVQKQKEKIKTLETKHATETETLQASLDDFKKESEEKETYYQYLHDTNNLLMLDKMDLEAAIAQAAKDKEDILQKMDHQEAAIAQAAEDKEDILQQKMGLLQEAATAKAAQDKEENKDVEGTKRWEHLKQEDKGEFEEKEHEWIFKLEHSEGLCTQLDIHLASGLGFHVAISAGGSALCQSIKE